MLTQAGYVSAFFSQDEYIEFFARGDRSLDEVRAGLTKPGLSPLCVSGVEPCSSTIRE